MFFEKMNELGEKIWDIYRNKIHHISTGVRSMGLLLHDKVTTIFYVRRKGELILKKIKFKKIDIFAPI